MQRLEVSGAVRPMYGSLGVKGLIIINTCYVIFVVDITSFINPNHEEEATALKALI